MPPSRRASSSKYLFAHWPEVRDRIRAARQVRLLLDFDGTLVGFRPLPHQVRLGAAVRKVLAALAAHRRVRAAIVSGRRRSDLKNHISIPHVELFGLYGWDRGRNARLPASTLRKVALAREVLAAASAGLPGIFIEDKGKSLAVHFRGAGPGVQRLIQRRVNRLMRRLAPQLHLLRSSTTWEVAPKQIRGKGHALREYLRTVRGPYLAIYLGDDLTDEPAFAALPRGVTILVGPARKTAAGYRLEHHGEVLKFLRRLAAELGGAAGAN